MALVGRLRDALGSRSGAGLFGRVAEKLRAPEPVRAPAPTSAAAPKTGPLPTGPLPTGPLPPRTTGSLAAAARHASEHGVSSATTFRAPQQEAPPEDEEESYAQAPTEPLSTRDIVIGEEQHDAIVRIAPDGARYHGPTDNESARSKAAGHRLDIDRNECIGCGTCVEHIDTVFWLNGDEGKAYVLVQDGAMDHIQDAIDACPVTCISWKEA